jgi:hypothetical protein
VKLLFFAETLSVDRGLVDLSLYQTFMQIRSVICEIQTVLIIEGYCSDLGSFAPLVSVCFGDK